MKRFIAIMSIAIIFFPEYSYSFNFTGITKAVISAFIGHADDVAKGVAKTTTKNSTKVAAKTLVTGIAIKITALSDEAISTINLIKKGGPFPYPSKDGTIFKNIEGKLAPQSSGYYKEYTVPSPNVTNRGAKRIVTGQNGEMYYTEDHYQTFMEIIQ